MRDSPEPGRELSAEEIRWWATAATADAPLVLFYNRSGFDSFEAVLNDLEPVVRGYGLRLKPIPDPPMTDFEYELVDAAGEFAGRAFIAHANSDPATAPDPPRPVTQFIPGTLFDDPPF